MLGEGKILEILDPSTIAFLLLAGFIAAFIDSTVGGGGLISTPALLALGLPVNFALGTNKLAASMGSLMSVLSFWKAGKINEKAALMMMPLSFLGSALGAYVVYLLPEQLMKNVIVVMLVAVAVYTYRRKDWGDVSSVKKLGITALIGSLIMAFGIGFYDGFFGPGTGSFLIFGFLFLGYDFVTAAGNAILMGFAMVIGAYFGSRMAIKHGASYVKPLYLIVTTLLIGKQVYELLFK